MGFVVWEIGMPIYEFTNISLSHVGDPMDDRKFDRNRCRVIASDDGKAKQILLEEFVGPSDRDYEDPLDLIFSIDMDDSQCIILPATYQPPHEYREGLILLCRRSYDGGDDEWFPINEDHLPEVPSIQYELSPITPETVRRTTRNRIGLQLQTAALIDFLEQLVGPENIPPDRRNVSVKAELGLSASADERQIVALLIDLKNELRRFNEALEKSALGNQKLDPKVLERLRDIGIGHLEALSTNKAFVTLQSVSIGCMTWSLLERAGLINVQTVALLKAITDLLR